jgi:hypothetical protein
MPVAQPTMGAAFGSRGGVTALNGSLMPVIAPGFATRIGADIGALPIQGIITTSVSAGFTMGLAPAGTTMVLVTVAGTATLSRAAIEALGGYAHAHAELSITIEEWAPHFPLRIPSKGMPPPPRPATLVRSVTFNATKLFDDWGAGLSFQVRIDDGTPFACVAGMPISTAGIARLHTFIGWINLNQLAEAYAETGYAAAVSNVAFDFPPPFFAFI